MKDINEKIALELKQIDASKIPAFTYTRSREKRKNEIVFIYVSELKKFISVDIKQLRRKTLNVNVIMMQNNLNVFNTLDNVCYYFYNIDKFKKDYPCSAIEIFEKQKNVYYDIQNSDKYLMKYAWLYQQYNIMEQLIKSGFSDLIYSLINRNSSNYYRIENMFDIDGKNICEITGLKKSYFQLVRDNVKSIDLFIAIKKFLDNNKISAQQLERLIDIVKSNENLSISIDSMLMRSLNSIEELLAIEYENRRLYTFGSLINYVERQTVEQGYYQVHTFLGTLYDYIKMCVDMNIKPDVKTKNLQRDHNVLVVQYNQIKDQEIDKKYKTKFNRQYNKLKQCSYHDNRLEVIVPRNPKDIIEEGRNNHNCVGSYVETHASGKSFIFFIRKIDALDKSYITVELDKNLSTVKQAFYSFNKELNSTDNNFINKWMKQLAERREINEH